MNFREQGKTKMMKQIYRVKQLADQTFARAEKSEALTEDIQHAEKYMESIRNSCLVTSKKITACMTSQSIEDVEKRLKKMPQIILGNAMMECAVPLGDDSILSSLLVKCGELECQLGTELLKHENKLDKDVLIPLQQIDSEANNIRKSRHNLSKLILDMDSAKARYQAAIRSSSNSATKSDVLKEEMDEAQQIVDQSRDSLAADIYSLLSKEAEYAELILKFAEYQKEYHQSVLRILENSIPELEQRWKRHGQKPVFGCDLEDHLKTQGRAIAYPIEICICTLLSSGLREEGLFRIAGGASKMKKFKAALDASRADLRYALDLSDVHVVAGTLKLYLRELPDPLFGFELYEEWLNAVRLTDHEERLQALKETYSKLSEARKANIRYLFKFLSTLTRYCEENKMSPHNLAIVLAPSLIWSSGNDADALALNMTRANYHSSIVDNLISYADWFFPEEIEFFITCSKSTPITPANQQVFTYTDIGEERYDIPNKVESKMHRRMDSNEGIGQLKKVPSSGNISDTSTGNMCVESPKLVNRTRKRAPIPPANPGSPKTPQTIPQTTSNLQQQENVDKDKKNYVHDTGTSESRKLMEKPAPPPVGPDRGRVSSIHGKKPELAPRPSINTAASQTGTNVSIGFEHIEKEINDKAQKPTEISNNKSDDEITDQVNNISNPVTTTAVEVKPPPVLERTKFDSEKSRPAIPDRPTAVLKPQGSSQAQVPGTNKAETQLPPVLERIQSFSVDKQQVSIVHVNNQALTLNTSDPEILYADSDDITPTSPVPPPEATKPERPPKPERSSLPSSLIESNNNKSDTNPENSVFPVPPIATLPRPAPRPQPPLPPNKQRTNNLPSQGENTNL